MQKEEDIELSPLTHKDYEAPPKTVGPPRN